jgi:hypothetical protein
MKKLLPLSFIGLILLSACSKNSEPAPINPPAPAPPPTTTTATVEARWQIDSTWVSDGTAAGVLKKNDLKILRPGTVNCEFVAGQYSLYVGATLDKQLPYKVNGNILGFSGGGGANDRVIKELTAHRMVLVGLRDQAVLSPLYTITTTYSR